MQCTTILASGLRCAREARPEFEKCSRHKPRGAKKPSPPPEPQSVAPAEPPAPSPGPHDYAPEIEAIRALIADRVAAGDLGGVRAGVASLTSLVHLQRLEFPAPDRLTSRLEQALDHLDLREARHPLRRRPVLPV